MITSPSKMSKLANTYQSIMHDWITDYFVNPDTELHLERLRAHEYCESNSARQMRKMDDVHLVDFIELELKGKEPIGIAYDVALATGLKSYLKMFVFIQPGVLALSILWQTVNLREYLFGTIFHLAQPKEYGNSQAKTSSEIT